MAMIARVAVSGATYAIDLPYVYVVPDSLRVRVCPGMRVMVPFGLGNRHMDGVVLAVGEGELSPGTKTITALLDEEPLFCERMLQLALWMRQQYFCTVYDSIRVMLPASLWFVWKDCWVLEEDADRERALAAAGKSPGARQLVELLFAHGGRMEMGKIRAAFGLHDPTPALRRLEQSHMIRLETSASRRMGEKTEQIALLTLSPQEALERMERRRKRAPVQYAVVEQLALLGSASARELCYFTGASMATLRALERYGVLTLERQEAFPQIAIPDIGPRVEIRLNEEQQAAWLGLCRLLPPNEPSVALLHGVTGSGKTLVYLKLIDEVLKQGKSALILVPEIALTPQLMGKFISCFGDRVAVMHSMLTATERYDAWKRIRKGDAQVVVGTRSAVFVPMQNLGLMILDEEQEASYKSEQTPKYHAREVAHWRCVKEHALLLLGSATPSVETMYQAEQGKYHRFSLSQRYNRQAMPEVSIVDMKQELRQGRGDVIGQVLAQALQEVVERGEQAVLFLNRRGAHKMVTCGECGQVPDCPRCSVHLTYHSANGRLMCHYCGHSHRLPDRCPNCGGLFHLMGAGTQKVEEELRERLPGVPVIRMDADTVTAVRTHARILSEFEQTKGSILVGTQMVAKGLDFPRVTLAGIVAADQSLYLDDFRAAERTFSLLTQVVGRAGRGAYSGRAVIQTFTPEHEVIQCAAQQDYQQFYQQEIAFRRMNGLPPFSDLFVLTVTGLEESAVLRACQRARDFLSAALAQERYQNMAHRLMGPAPMSILKVNNRFRYRITLMAKHSREIRELIAHLLQQMQKDKGNRGLSVFADRNPWN